MNGSKCKFCDPEQFKQYDIGTERDSRAPLRLENWYGQQMITVDLGCGYWNRYIPKYCPECGRKILSREETNKNVKQ